MASHLVHSPTRLVRHRRDDHEWLTFNIPEQEHILNTHIDQLAQWYADAERITDTNLPRSGDTLIFPYNAGGYAIEVEGGDWTPGDVVPGESARILHRAPKPKPAWHDAVAVTADVGRIDGARRVFVKDENGVWIDALTSHGYAAVHLRDVTPLIEAKVTDEMVGRALDAADRHEAVVINTAIIREALTAALGLETE